MIRISGVTPFEIREVLATGSARPRHGDGAVKIISEMKVQKADSKYYPMPASRCLWHCWQERLGSRGVLAPQGVITSF